MRNIDKQQQNCQRIDPARKFSATRRTKIISVSLARLWERWLNVKCLPLKYNDMCIKCVFTKCKTHKRLISSVVFRYYFYHAWLFVLTDAEKRPHWSTPAKYFPFWSTSHYHHCCCYYRFRYHYQYRYYFYDYHHCRRCQCDFHYYRNDIPSPGSYPSIYIHPK